MSLGTTLREAREAKGMTVAQVAEQTRMIHQMVEELENDDFHRIAAAIYGRGFIRLYAECVELDPDPLVKEFNEAYSGFRRPSINTRQVRTEPVSAPVKKPVEKPAEAASRPVVKERAVEMPPVFAPAPVVVPEVKPAPAPVVVPEVKPAPAPVVVPESVPAAVAEPVPEPAPQSGMASRPATDAVPDAIPAPETSSETGMAVGPQTAAVPESASEPVAPAPSPAPASTPDAGMASRPATAAAIPEPSPAPVAPEEPKCVVPEKQKPDVLSEPVNAPVFPVAEFASESLPDPESSTAPESKSAPLPKDETSEGDEQYGELFNRTVVTPAPVVRDENERDPESRHAPLPVFTPAPSWDDNESVSSDSFVERIRELFRKAPYTIAGIGICIVAIIMLLIAIAASSGGSDAEEAVSVADNVVETEITGDLPVRTTASVTEQEVPASSAEQDVSSDETARHTSVPKYTRHILPPPDSYVK